MPTSLDALELPPGRWAVGVSGGADSVALARLAARRGGVVLAHLDHQLRGTESDDDAAFVIDLGRQLSVVVEAARRDDIERRMASDGSSLPPLQGGGGERNSSVQRRNPSARYRAARLAFFADVVQRHGLDGVLLAHHADDQAETILLRLLRGRGLTGLGGIAITTRVNGLVVARPLLGIHRDRLRDHLNTIGQPWREDASNASLDYRRNVVRRLLAANPAWTGALLRLANTSAALRGRVEATAVPLAEGFACVDLGGPPLRAEHAARQWLVARGVPVDRVSPALCQRLVAQAVDVTRSPRQHYPGGVLVRRRQKRIDVVSAETHGARLQSPSTHGQETDTPAEL